MYLLSESFNGQSCVLDQSMDAMTNGRSPVGRMDSRPPLLHSHSVSPSQDAPEYQTNGEGGRRMAENLQGRNLECLDQNFTSHVTFPGERRKEAAAYVIKIPAILIRHLSYLGASRS